jgi:hypothetical protein
MLCLTRSALPIRRRLILVEDRLLQERRLSLNKVGAFQLQQQECTEVKPEKIFPRPRPRHHYDRNCPDETSKAATATNTNKSSRASLQLNHKLGGYIRRMRSCAPTEDLKNASNTKIHQLSLSATPRLPLRLGGY